MKTRTGEHCAPSQEEGLIVIVDHNSCLAAFLAEIPCDSTHEPLMLVCPDCLFSEQFRLRHPKWMFNC